MKKFLSTFIGTLLALSLLVTQARATYAIYSPRVSQEIAKIKMHIKTSKERNGFMSLEEVWKNVAAANKALKEQKQAFGTPGKYIQYQKEQKLLLLKNLTFSFFNDIALLFGSFSDLGWYSACLRDDVWTLQALQEEVTKEMYKAALLSDHQNADILWNDYKLLYAIINGGVFQATKDGKVVVSKEYKEKGLMWESKDTAFWFGEGDVHNYYVDCPYGELTQAVKEVVNSFWNIVDTFSSGGEGGLFAGGLAEMAAAAQKRAKLRASNWIAANQLKVTFGGQQGGNPRSLIQGFEKNVVAELRTYGDYIKGFAKEIKPTFDTDTATVREIYKEYEKVEKDRKILTNQMETALIFNLSFNNVADESLKTLDKTLFQINKEIKRAFDFELSEVNLQSFCEQLRVVATTQCKNHSAEAPTCK